MSPDTGTSGASSSYAQPVAVGIFEITFPPGETLFVDRDSELFRDGVDVVEVQVDQGVGTSVALVFRQVEPDVAARHRDNHGHPGSN